MCVEPTWIPSSVWALSEVTFHKKLEPQTFKLCQMRRRERKLRAGRQQKQMLNTDPKLLPRAICWNPGHTLQLTISAFSSDKHFGSFNWLNHVSQDRLHSNTVSIHCFTNCGVIASVTRDITIKSTALLRQTGWLKAVLFHRPTVTEITLSASFPYILSTFTDQRTVIIVGDLSRMDKRGLSISGKGVD